MTDRVKGLYVTLDRDMRTDDVDCVMQAIQMVKYVSSVTHEGLVTDVEDHYARERIRRELSDVVNTVFRGVLTGDVGFCHDKPKTIAALEKVLKQLKDKQ
jgi:hypothetical protein